MASSQLTEPSPDAGSCSYLVGLSCRTLPHPPRATRPVSRAKQYAGHARPRHRPLDDAGRHQGIGEWGFAALVEADGHRLLFDTGARPETVLANARELGIDLAGVTDVVLSHHHGDHTGGLLTLRRALSKTNPAGALAGLCRPRHLPVPAGADGGESNETIALKAPYEATGGRSSRSRRPTEIFPGAWLTGPVPRDHPERNWSGRAQVRTAEGLVEDTIPEDMSLVLDTERGLVVVTGCGHAGVINTLEFARERIRVAPVVAAGLPHLIY